MMKYLRPYLPVILVVLPVIVLVLIRAMMPGSFKPDAGKRAGASFTGANLLTRDQVAALGSKPLVVKIGNEMAATENRPSDTLYVEAGRLLEKENLKAIEGYQGVILLVSDNPAISAKAWMILSQMGYRELYVFAEKENSEVLKYKFRPDSAAGI
jgi:hypothetical protein